MRANRVETLRSVLRITALAAFVAFGHAALGAGAEPAGPMLGAWVRIKTGDHVRAKGFELTSGEDAERASRSGGRVVADDWVSVTIEIDGGPVRVMRPRRVAEGKLRLIDATSLVFERDEPTRPILVPRDAVSRLEVRQRQSRKGRGVLIGLLSGAAIGALIGMSSSSGQDGLGLDSESLGAAAGAVIGAPIGALIGYVAAPGARWEEQRGVRVSVVRVGF